MADMRLDKLDPPIDVDAWDESSLTDAMLGSLGHRIQAAAFQFVRWGPSSGIESPADKLLRSVEPWSSYVVLPIFALANAGVAWSADVFQTNGRLMTAIVLGLVVGKSAGIVARTLSGVPFEALPENPN